ncbi:dioxygenase family protein [Mycobacterium kansasii]|uniref:Dioxygenase family protein n=1 Tax=Mycobacterium kansasii TaxID=1768 RepID=A0A1V3XYY6_MYCKA|nr:dioxygenase family protein [Mycobacterium kansasii]
MDPNFTGTGRCLTDDDGGYRFITIRPGAYPWRNHQNAWRPAHIHFSVFGTAFTQRMITQMYFPSDPLLALDPIYQSVTDPKARERLVARYDHDVSTPNQLSATGGTLCSPAITAPPWSPDDNHFAAGNTRPIRGPVLRPCPAFPTLQRTHTTRVVPVHPSAWSGDRWSRRACPRRADRNLAARR